MGTTNIIYVFLSTLIVDMTPNIMAAIARLQQQSDNSNLIVDLRVNPGGNEAFGQNLVWVLQRALLLNDTSSSMATTWVAYATQSFRSSPTDESLFYQTDPLTIVYSAAAKTPMVVALTSRQCVSSCEGTLLAFRAAGTRIVGEHTAGARGNPVAFQVPNVGLVLFSRWRWGNAEGQMLEGIGIEPDVKITAKVTPMQDPVL